MDDKEKLRTVLSGIVERRGMRMTTRLRMKVGSAEFEYEGPIDFTQDFIKELFSHMEGLTPPIVSPDLPKSSVVSSAAASISIPLLHINTIASKLGVKTGPELAIAALASMQIIKGADKATRSEILEEMKSASSYFQANMAGNLSKILKTLVTNHKFNQISQNTFALNAAERAVVEQKLA